VDEENEVVDEADKADAVMVDEVSG